MPDLQFDFTVGFLRQNSGRFSKRAREWEFAELKMKLMKRCRQLRASTPIAATPYFKVRAKII
jgi:hypothetical protein